jgi:hypothetical protein
MPQVHDMTLELDDQALTKKGYNSNKNGPLERILSM